MSDPAKNKILMYSSRFCPFCMRAKALLTSKDVEFDEVLVDGKAKLRDKMTAMSRQRTVPQIWIGTQHVGGCDDLYALERAGKLDTLLEGF